MSNFKIKLHRIRFRLELRPRPMGSLQRSPNPLLDLRGPILLREKRERGKERGRESGRHGWPLCKFLNTPLADCCKLTQQFKTVLLAIATYGFLMQSRCLFLWKTFLSTYALASDQTQPPLPSYLCRENAELKLTTKSN